MELRACAADKERAQDELDEARSAARSASLQFEELRANADQLGILSRKPERSSAARAKARELDPLLGLKARKGVS